MAVGNFFLLDRALKKIVDGTINLETMALKAILATSAQAVDKTFLGSSGDARYADLTGELTTANGYTAGGVALANVTLSRPSASIAQLTADPWSWTITGAGITFKYGIIYVDGATNDDLLMVADLENTGGSITTIAGLLQVTPNVSGLARWNQ
jgi:hypothetical protein